MDNTQVAEHLRTLVDWLERGAILEKFNLEIKREVIDVTTAEDFPNCRSMLTGQETHILEIRVKKPVQG